MDVAILCPLCGYDLRGLPRPRCPECGFESPSWEELREQLRATHPYLFEHHPHHPAKAFWRTLVGGLFPGRFWRLLQPTAAYAPRRLAGYASIVIAMGIAPAMIVQLLRTARAASQNRIGWRGLVGPLYHLSWPEWWPRSFIDGFGDKTQAVNHVLLIWVALALLWPAMTWLGLMIFQMSMRCARIKVQHVFRSVVYSADGVVFTGILVPVALLVTFPLAPGPKATFVAGWMIVSALVGQLVLFVYRLFAAYRLYLRFNHAIMTVLAVQVILVLIVLILLLQNLG